MSAPQQCTLKLSAATHPSATHPSATHLPLARLAASLPACLPAEDNDLKGSLPASWSGMHALQAMSVRAMCGVCGAVPFSQSEFANGAGGCWGEGRPCPSRAPSQVDLSSGPNPGLPAPGAMAPSTFLKTALRLPSLLLLAAGVDVWVQGSSLDWPCSSGNCYRVPLGFVGQAVIVAGAGGQAGGRQAATCAAAAAGPAVLMLAWGVAH